MNAAHSCGHEQLVKNKLIQKKPVEILADIALGPLRCKRVETMNPARTASIKDTFLLRHKSCWKALDIARISRDMHGGNTFTYEFGVARYLVNLEMRNICETTHEVNALILGRVKIGIADSAN